MICKCHHTITKASDCLSIRVLNLKVKSPLQKVETSNFFLSDGSKIVALESAVSRLWEFVTRRLGLIKRVDNVGITKYHHKGMLKFWAQAHRQSELRKFVYLFLKFKKVNLKIESFVKFLCVFGGCKRVKPQKAVL